MKPADLIRRFEGCRLDAYPDPESPLAKGQGTDGRPWTIGYGCTGPDVRAGMHITQEQADAMLEHRLGPLTDTVRAMVKVPLTDGQLAALCSFEWNEGKLHSSKLLRFLNAGDYLSAAGQFLHWEYARHEWVKGLATRREAELQVFMDSLLG